MTASELHPDRFASLDGYVVLDFTQFLSGPLCTSILAALGADVIKIEPPEGEGNRAVPPFVSQIDDLDWGGPESLIHLKRNAGKRSVVIDLKAEGSREIVRRLVQHADVVVHNFRGGVDERLGIDEKSLRAINDKIVYCAIAGQFDGIGDPAELRNGTPGGVIDVIGQALSGLMAASGTQEGGPQKSRGPIADQTTGLYAAICVLTGLLSRDGGRGLGRSSSFRVPMVETLGSLLWDEHLDVYRASGAPERVGNSSKRLSPYNIYPTKDGKFVTVAAVSRREWLRLLDACDVVELRKPEYLTMEGRIADSSKIDDLLGNWTVERTRDEIIARMRRHGVTAGALMDVDDMVDDGPYRDGVLYSVEGEVISAGEPAAPVRPLAPRFPAEVDGRRLASFAGRAPRLGENTAEVLQSVCDFSDADIADYCAGRFGTSSAPA